VSLENKIKHGEKYVLFFHAEIIGKNRKKQKSGIFQNNGNIYNNKINSNISYINIYTNKRRR